jgi:hypothetical protein
MNVMTIRMAVTDALDSNTMLGRAAGARLLALALGPHPQRVLTPMLRLPLGMAVGALP